MGAQLIEEKVKNGWCGVFHNNSSEVESTPNDVVDFELNGHLGPFRIAEAKDVVIAGTFGSQCLLRANWSVSRYPME